MQLTRAILAMQNTHGNAQTAKNGAVTLSTAFCGKRIETGEKCYGLPNGESVCTDCCVAENEGAAVSDGEKEQENDNGNG